MSIILMKHPLDARVWTLARKDAWSDAWALIPALDCQETQRAVAAHLLAVALRKRLEKAHARSQL